MTWGRWAGLLAAGAAVRLVLVGVAPLYPAEGNLPGYNDEPLHLFYVRHLAEGGGWPVWSADFADSVLAGEFTQPPLYYALAAPWYRLGGMRAVRGLSVVLGLIAALFTFRAVQVAFGEDREGAPGPTALGAGAAMLLAPNAVVFTSLVTNDALLVAMSALVFHSVAECRRVSEERWGRQLLTGLFISGAVWAKMSGLTLLPLAWFAAGPGLSARERGMVRLRVGLTALGGIMPLVAWNLAHYGQVVPLTPGYGPEAAVGVAGGGVFHPIWAGKLALRYAAQPWEALWGSGGEKLVTAGWVAVWAVVAALGLGQTLRRGEVRWVVAGVVFPIAGFIWHNLGMFQVEFRLMAPAYPALAGMAAAGAEKARVSPVAQALLWATPMAVWV